MENNKKTLQQTYNILCITKRHEAPDPWGNTTQEVDWHRYITGRAEIILTSKPKIIEYGVIISKTIVRFHGTNGSFFFPKTYDGDYDFLYTRSGLNGTSVVIAIENKEEPPFNVWELYTDKPAQEGITTKDVRKMAEQEIAKHYNN